MKAKRRWFWLSFYSTRTKASRRGRQPFWSWMTGETMDEPPRYTIVCLVEDVASEAAAWKLVRSWWPRTVGEIRFCKEVERGWCPGDRFPGYVPPPEFASAGG